MKDNSLLGKIESISSFKELLKSNEYREILVSNVVADEVIAKSFGAIDGFDEMQEKYFLSYLHFVDKQLSSKMRFSISRKLMTILVGGIYIGDFYDKVKCYDLLHLMSISFFSVFDSLEMICVNFEVFSKNIFECYKEKTNDFMYYVSFNEVVRNLYDNGSGEEEIIEYLRSKRGVELLRESAEIVEEIVEQDTFSI